MEDTKELEFILRSLLISSPKVTSANKLLKDYEDSEHRPFPFRKLGFGSFVEYLKSIPSVVQLSPINSYNPDVLPVVTKATSHIDKLVSKQRVTAPRKNNSRRGGFNGRSSRPMPTRRRPPTYNSSSYFRPAPNKGVSVREINNDFSNSYNREDLTRNGIHSGNDVLHHADTMVERINDRVYPNMTLQPDFSSQSNHNSYSSEINAMPAGSEEDYDDLDFEDDTFWENVPEEVISNYTLKRCTEPVVDSQSLDATSKRVEEKEEPKESERYNNNEEEYFSQGMINNFRSILGKNPNGIWASELQKKYFEEFGVTLDLLDLGFSSAITMVSRLPSVFKYERAGSHDWKLYDAQSIVENSVDKSNVAGHLERYGDDDNEYYVPQSILENIKNLVKKHGCVRSTQLLYFYRVDFRKSLDLESLGFNRLEEFLDKLKSYINITKVQDHFLLMPKHSVVETETPAPNEVLTVPKEYLSFTGPDNVVRLGDTIPYQELPPVETKPESPFDPLLELEVRVAEVFTPEHFYLVLDSKFNDLQSMMEDLHHFYELEESHFHIPLPSIAPNLICACIYENCWHRAKVTACRKNDFVEIEYIDYGTPQTVKRSELRFLHNDFAKVPAQSICAKLMGIRPKTGEKKWSEDACKAFLGMVSYKRLIAHVYAIGVKTNKERMQLELILYDTNGPKEIIYNEVLIKKGLAETCHQEQGASEGAAQVISQGSTSVTHQSSTSATHQGSTSVPHQSSTSVMQQGSTPGSNQSSNYLNYVKTPKQAIRPPPGFEAFQANSTYASSQVSKFTLPPSTVQRAPTNCPPSPNMILNYPPYTVTENSSSYIVTENRPMPLLINYPQLHQSQHIINPPNYGANNPLYYQDLLPPIQYLSSTQSYSYLPQPSYPPQRDLIIPRQPFNNAPKFGNAVNITSLPRDNQYNYNSGRTPEKGTDWGGEMPKYQLVSQATSSTTWQPVPVFPPVNQVPLLLSSPGHSPVLRPSPVLSPPSPYPVAPESYFSQRNISHASTDTSFKRTPEKEILISRPVTPLTPSSAEVANLCNRQNDNQKTTNLMYQRKLFSQAEKEIKTLLQNTSLYEATNNNLHTENSAISFCSNPMISPSAEVLNSDSYQAKRGVLKSSMSEPLDEVTNTQSVLESFIHSSNPTRDSSASDEYASASELLELDNIPISAEIPAIEDNLHSNSVPVEKEMSEKIPDSWEDIDPDDTPANSKNFSEDFKDPLDLIINENETRSNISLSSDLVVTTAEKNFENGLLSTDISKAPVNWKEIFDPDLISKPKWCKEGKIDNKKFTSPDQINVEKVLVQKLEINNKFFHLISVNGEPAVLSLEFYPQFTSFNLHTILKIIDVKHKPFPVINQVNEPALFSELQKIEFCGGVNRRNVLRLGKVIISYLSEVPEVFAVLNIKDKMLLDTIRNISDDFKSAILNV